MQYIPEIYLIDGENLVNRFQAMKDAGRVPREHTIHVPDTLVWNPALVGTIWGDIRRVSYYTSVVGDEVRVASIERQIREFGYVCRSETMRRTQHVFPRVFKKPSKSVKSRSVDINIVIDALRYARNQAVGLVCIVSGDGDFAPLAQELIHAGVQVHVWALSSGLSPQLEASADMYRCVDDSLFEPAV